MAPDRLLKPDLVHPHAIAEPPLTVYDEKRGYGHEFACADVALALGLAKDRQTRERGVPGSNDFINWTKTIKANKHSALIKVAINVRE